VVARHVQVQQHQVDRLAFEGLQHAVQRIRLADLQVGDGLFRRAMQCGAEQGMVVGDQQGWHVQARLAKHPQPGTGT